MINIDQDLARSRPRPRFTNFFMVEVFLKFELYLHQNLDQNLDSNKLDLGLGLALARGPTRGAPIYTTRHDIRFSKLISIIR